MSGGITAFQAALLSALVSASSDVFATALELGGTITGEHGVGVLKMEWLDRQLGNTAMDVTRAIKDAIDPMGLLNPGKLTAPRTK